MKSFCVLNKTLNNKMAETVGACFGQSLGGKVGIVHSGDGASASIAQALAGGVKSVGAFAAEFGTVNESRIRFLVNNYGLTSVLFVSNSSLVSAYNHYGMPLTEQEETILSAALSTGGFEYRSGGESVIVNSDDSYMKALIKAGENLENIAACIKCKNSCVKSVLTAALSLLGADCGTKPSFFISNSGFCVSACDEQGNVLQNETLLDICCKCVIEEARELTVPFSAPKWLDDLSEAKGVRLSRSFYGGVEPWQTDGVFLVIELMRYMSKRGMSLSALSSELPCSYRKRKSFSSECNLSVLADAVECDEIVSDEGTGVFARIKNSGVLFTPYRKNGKYCMEIISDDVETADALAENLYNVLST